MSMISMNTQAISSQEQSKPAADPILGSILDDLKKRINSVILQQIKVATNSIDNIDLKSGREVAIAIENARNAYSKCLDDAMSRVDKVIHEKITSLVYIVQKVENFSIKNFKQLEENVQQWIHTLPIDSGAPQLNHVNRYAIVDDSKKCLFSFKGNFRYAKDERYKPTLVVDGKEQKLVSSTSRSLDFEVECTASQDKCNYIKGKLRVPYEKGWLTSSIKTAQYKVLLGLLPSSPGKITVYYTSHKIERATKHITSATIKASGDKDHPARWTVKRAITYPERGWFVIPNSVRGPFVHTDPKPHGSHHIPWIYNIDSQRIITDVGLAAYDEPHMGRLEYHVEFDQVQDTAVRETRKEDITLKWGESKVLTPRDQEEVLKIVYDSFDEIHSEFGGPSLNNPYLRIAFNNGKYELRAEVPADL